MIGALAQEETLQDLRFIEDTLADIEQLSEQIKNNLEYLK